MKNLIEESTLLFLTIGAVEAVNAANAGPSLNANFKLDACKSRLVAQDEVQL